MLRNALSILGITLLILTLVAVSRVPFISVKADPPGKSETAIMNWSKHNILISNRAQFNPLKNDAAGIACWPRWLDRCTSGDRWTSWKTAARVVSGS